MIDYDIRGLLDSTLDTLVEDESLQNMNIMFDGFKPLINDYEDAALGFIVGMMLEKIRGLYLLKNESLPTTDEYFTVYRMIEQKSPYISGRLKEYYNR